MSNEEDAANRLAELTGIVTRMSVEDVYKVGEMEFAAKYGTLIAGAPPEIKRVWEKLYPVGFGDGWAASQTSLLEALTAAGYRLVRPEDEPR